jgi:HEAT repeat protein
MAGIVTALLVGGWLAGKLSNGGPGPKNALTVPVQTQTFRPRPGAVPSDQPSPPAVISSSSSFRERFLKATGMEELRVIARDMILSNTEADLRAWAEILLVEKDPVRRAALLEALDLLQGEASLEMITQLITLSGEADVTAALIRTLGRAANPDTVQHLVEIHASAESASPERRRVLEVLGSITNPYAVPGLVELAGKPSLGEDVTGRAIISLSKIGDKAAMSGLVDAYESLAPNAAQRPQILEGISSSSNPASRPFLEMLASSSPFPEVVTAAKQGLNNLAGGDSLPAASF